MKKVFILDGGAGRALSAIPAFEKYYDKHGPNFHILCMSGYDFFWGNKKLQDLCIPPDGHNTFETYIRDNEIKHVEPYLNRGYYNQEKHLTEAFDAIINETDDHSDLGRPRIHLSKEEELHAIDAIQRARNDHGKEKTIVIQPYGRSAQVVHETFVVDGMSRSLNKETFLKIVSALRKEYNVLYFGEIQTQDAQDAIHVQTGLRQWAAIIEACDYFIGCDSVGQHMAYGFDIPGTVIMGSTFVENVSYGNHFQIIEKQGADKKYFPIRIAEGINGELVNRYNDTCMDFDEKETKEIIDKILSDIKKKT